MGYRVTRPEDVGLDGIHGLPERGRNGLVVQPVDFAHQQCPALDVGQGRDFGVQSSKVWRLADLGAKHAFLRAGLGWGHMPLHMVEADLANGALVRIELMVNPTLGPGFSMHAIHLNELPPGPAGRWFIDRLKQA